MNDHQLAMELRDRALSRVERGQPDWFDHAWSALDTYRRTFREQEKTFTAPGFLSYAERLLGLPEPTEPRILGALFKKAAIAKLIERTGDYTPSPSPKQHLRPVAVWRLL